MREAVNKMPPLFLVGGGFKSVGVELVSRGSKLCDILVIKLSNKTYYRGSQDVREVLPKVYI